MSVDRAVDLPRSQGPTTTHSGAYVEEENAASGAKTKRGALISRDSRCKSDRTLGCHLPEPGPSSPNCSSRTTLRTSP
jgi:hypothetical protein